METICGICESVIDVEPIGKRDGFKLIECPICKSRLYQRFDS